MEHERKVFLAYLSGYADDIDVLTELAYYAKNQKIKEENCLEFEGYTAKKLKELLPETPTTQIYYYMRMLKHNPDFKSVIEREISDAEYKNSDEYKKWLKLADMSNNSEEWHEFLENIKDKY